MQGMTVYPDTEYRDMGNLITYSCPVAHPMMNAVVQTNFDPETVDADIQQVIARVEVTRLDPHPVERGTSG